MLILGFLLIGLILIMLQTTVLMFHPLWAAAPDLYYLLVGYLAYHYRFFPSLVILIFLGWVYDLLVGVVLGMYPAICIGGFFILRGLGTKMQVKQSLYRIPLVGLSYLVVSWLVYLVVTLQDQELINSWSWSTMCLRVGLIILIGQPLFFCFDGVKWLFFKKASTLIHRSRPGNRFR